MGGSDLVAEVVVVDREGRDQRVRLQYDPVSQAGEKYSDISPLFGIDKVGWI